MLRDLFEDDDSQCRSSESAGTVSKSSSIPKPALPRHSTQLCGLSNLGATCYLNSLLQTLHHTPEFREALFSLTAAELGLESDAKDADKSMVRAIPIQLQCLFSRLLLLDQASATVTALTDSFGWTNNEELQQHDVQELNRILFSAVESSLLGTSGEQLISKLYHGSTVQQITCQVCGQVSEREEEFLDLPVALSGHSGLEDALKDSYVKLESLEKQNQYYCGYCKKLVDAKRGCHIRKLPAILTFALLRFLYDFKKGERYKDTNRFKFPMVVDMSPYCEGGAVSVSDACYELFSVVIHSGSTHSGHYTAFIRDIDHLGKWTFPEGEPLKMPVVSDLIDLENPADLLATLLESAGGTASISKLCKSLQDKTGVTWNKRFKKQFGPILKFIKSCSERFTVIDSTHVSLISPTTSATRTMTSDPAEMMAVETDSNNSLNEATERTLRLDAGIENSKLKSSSERLEERLKNSSSPAQKEVKEEVEMIDVGQDFQHESRVMPAPGHRWFEFNDAEVKPIYSAAIEKMFQGKKSAYMLFYRKKSLTRPADANGCPTYGVPERLIVERASENAALEEERNLYERAINTVKLNLHHHSQYYYNNAALHRTTDTEPFFVSIDRRKTMRNLKEIIMESYPELMKVGGDPVCIHTARFLPAGLHLYDLVSDKDDACLAALDISNESHLFLWDGMQVRGEAVQVGDSCEPIQLHITYPATATTRDRSAAREAETHIGFHKNSTLREVRVCLSSLLGVQPNQVTISQVKVQERRGQTQSSVVVVLSSVKDKSTLAQLQLTDGDRLAVEREIKKGVQTLAHSMADKQNKMVSFIVEDRCSPLQDSNRAYPVFPVEMSKDETVYHLKSKMFAAISKEGDVRFRVEADGVSGLGPPLHEEFSLMEADIEQGKRVIMEEGRPPLPSQICLQCKLSGSSSVMTSEVMLEKTTTIGECCAIMTMALGLAGDSWHLCKTNWCGEEAGILEDETATLESEKLKSGDVLIVQEGRLPPKGYIRLAVSLFAPNHSLSAFEQRPLVISDGSPTSMGTDTTSLTPRQEFSDSQTAVATMEESSDAGGGEMFLHLPSPAQFYPPLPGKLLKIGAVEVKKESSVEELKMMILTLPALEKAEIISSRFLRVRELVNGRPGKIYKQASHSLRRLKFTNKAEVCCEVLTYEESLPTSAIVFNVCMRDPKERKYGPAMEVVYDTESSGNSSTPHALRVFLANLLQVPLQHLLLAKHKMESFEWIIVEDSVHVDSKRSKKKGHQKSSIKNAPLYLHDGDTIGYKDTRLCGQGDKDFATEEDDQGKAVLLAIQEDKRKRRKAKEDYDVFGPKEKKQRRPERGIKIYVPDYRAKQ